MSDEPKYPLLEGQAAMQDNKFWRIVAVALVGGLFYVGHGLHRGHEALPSLVNSAHAGGAGAQAMGGQYGIFTSSGDGNVLYCWSADGRGGASFRGAAKIDGKFIPGPAKDWSPTDEKEKQRGNREKP
ncbi:MAG TPA: hypothetical protein VFG04_30895 [Planctomycetaceae bacterium]|jgi:hypothetical protein|nr:hypothetical protein [Planctomycetaceae bacterium]